MKLRKILEKVEAASGFTSEEKGNWGGFPFFEICKIRNMKELKYLAIYQNCAHVTPFKQLGEIWDSS